MSRQRRVTTLEMIWEHLRRPGNTVAFDCPGGKVYEVDANSLKRVVICRASAAGIWLNDEFIDNDHIYYGAK